VVDFATNWKTQEMYTSKPKHLMFATLDTHDENYDSTLEGKKLPVKHCQKKSYGWYFVDETESSDGLRGWCDAVFMKPTFGTFKIKEAIEQFEKDECETIEEIFLIGYDLSVCVLSNAIILRAAFPNKKIAVLTDLCGCINKQTFDAACEVLKCQQIDLIESEQIN
jgi:nicotinamidase-related amidase